MSPFSRRERHANVTGVRKLYTSRGSGSPPQGMNSQILGMDIATSQQIPATDYRAY
jgi:hypothetical protein